MPPARRGYAAGARGLALLAMLGSALLGLAGAGSTALAQGRSIAVPWIGQKSASDCGRAVLASLAARRGRSAEAAYARIPDPADGARGYSITEMQRLGGRVGVGLALAAPAGVVIRGECTAGPAVGAHMANLARQIAAGRPVVVPVASGFGAGHYLILVAAGGDGFTALDPASPGLRRIGSADLAASMCGSGYIAMVAR